MPVTDLLAPRVGFAAAVVRLLSAAALYGAVLGSWHGRTLALYAAVKLPLVLVAMAARGAVRLWSIVLLLTSLQAATLLQPILYRSPNEPLFAYRRQLFLEHFRAASAIVLPEAADDFSAPADRR